MGRGQKTCESCFSVTGPRSLECPNCGQPFFVRVGVTKKRKKRMGVEVDWRELMPGDHIKVSGGPYWITENGEKVSLGYNGYFKVHFKDGKGLGCYSPDKKEGFCFIYMGKEQYIEETGVHRVPHKLTKLELGDKTFNELMRETA